MFYHRQDTGLIQCALISTSKLNSKDSQNAVNILFRSVRKIIYHNLESITDEKEKLKIQMSVHRRLHAAIFFTTLKSCGITSSMASAFYSSINHAWPAIDLNLYMELNFKSQWSEYFIECASQLPSEVLASLLMKFLNIPFPEQIKLYSWHLVLQAIIHKMLGISLNENELPFNFDFSEAILSPESVINNECIKSTVVEPLSCEKNEMIDECIKSDVENGNILDKTAQDLNSLFKVYYILCDNLCAELEKSNDIHLINILLHALKTLLKNLNDKKCSNIVLLPEFGKVCRLLKDCLKSNTNLKIIETSMDDYTQSFISHVYATNSWNVPDIYLILILDYLKNNVNTLSAVENTNPTIEVFIKEITDDYIYEKMKTLNPFYKDNLYEPNKHLELLLKIIQLDFIGASSAAEIILLNPILLANDNIFKVLEEHSYLISLKKLYPVLIKNIMTVQSPEIKIKILKFFYKILFKSPIEIYNEILEYMLSSYGMTENFHLPDFEDQLMQVVRQTLTANKALEIVPALFIQNPKSTLKCIIDQGLVQGSGAEALIQVLKLVPAACTYFETNEDIPFLLKILNNYLQTVKLETYESKNLVTLFKLVMEVQSKANIMCLDLFINKCILPNLQSSLSNRTTLVLESLEVSLNTLIASESLAVSISSLTSLIICLGHVIDSCIKSGNGKMKESVISVLSVLESYQKQTGVIDDVSKSMLYSSSTNMDESVHVYMKEFLPADIKFSSLAYLWTFCCRNKISTPLEDIISHEPLTYSSLLTILIQTLPHFTKEEWIFSITLIKLCCKNAVEEEIMQYLDTIFQLSESERNMYAVVSCLISSLQFILPNCVGEPLHISSCFSSILMSTLNQENLLPQMLMTIFLDVCHLISCLSPDLINIFTSALLDLQQYILSTSDEQSRTTYQKLINSSVKCLPESLEQSTLFSKINIII